MFAFQALVKTLELVIMPGLASLCVCVQQSSEE